MTDQYAVVGNPVAHSLSPRIHAWFAREANQNMCYGAIQATPDTFRQTVESFFERGGKGLNITVPFKSMACEMVSARGTADEPVGSVNTLLMDRQGRLKGTSTDGIGLVRDLEANLGLPLAGLRILVAGAGGAVAGVLPELLARDPERIDVVNRTPARTHALVERWRACPVRMIERFEDAGSGYDLVLNGTSASLAGQVPPFTPAIFTDCKLVYDMMYGSSLTPFLAWASNHVPRAHLSDGLGMLVEQAAEAFHLWRGVRPATGPVLDMLRTEWRGSAS